MQWLQCPLKRPPSAFRGMTLRVAMDAERTKNSPISPFLVIALAIVMHSSEIRNF